MDCICLPPSYWLAGMKCDSCGKPMRDEPDFQPFSAPVLFLLIGLQIVVLIATILKPMEFE